MTDYEQAVKDVDETLDGIQDKYVPARLRPMYRYAVAQREARLRLEETFRKLIEKLDLVEPAISSAFMMSVIHGGNYVGPTYGKELKDARAVLNAVKEG